MKSLLKFLVIVATVALFSNAAQAAVVINEIDPDQPGNPDTQEFVELHGPANMLLNGFVVVFMNGATDASYEAYDLDGWRTGPTGHFLLGNAGVVPTPDIIFPDVTLHNGADAVALYSGNAADFPFGTPATTTNLIDAIVYGTTQPDDTGLLTALAQSTQYDDTTLTSISRVPDGMGGRFTNGTAPTPMNSGLPQVPEPASIAIGVQIAIALFAASGWRRRFEN